MNKLLVTTKDVYLILSGLSLRVWLGVGVIYITMNIHVVLDFVSKN